MMKKFMIALALCLCTGILFAQTNAGATNSQSVFNGRVTGYNYSNRTDDLRRKNAGHMIDSIRNSPDWKSEQDAFIAEFHNSAAWKKRQDASAGTLKILGDHPGPKEYGIWREVLERINSELQSSEAYKIYQEKSKDFNKRLDRETFKQLYKDDPRYKTAF